MFEKVSTIGSETIVRADVRGAQDLVVEGQVFGSIAIDGALTVQPEAIVHASIAAVSVTIHGFVIGDVRARETIHLGPAARVRGDLESARIKLDSGARLSGKLEAHGILEAEEPSDPVLAPVPEAITERPMAATVSPPPLTARPVEVVESSTVSSTPATRSQWESSPERISTRRSSLNRPRRLLLKRRK